MKGRSMTEERPAYPSLENSSVRRWTPQTFGRDSTVTESVDDDYSDHEWPACWEDATSLLKWRKPYDRIVDEENSPFYRWFVGGRLNAAENCIDRHLEKRKNQGALRWEGKRGERRTYTYYDLYREVSAVAAALRELGVEADDVVTIYLPKLPEVPITMLACARLGAVHNVVFAGFAPDALVKRINTSTRPRSLPATAASARRPRSTRSGKPIQHWPRSRDRSPRSSSIDSVRVTGRISVRTNTTTTTSSRRTPAQT